MNKRERIRTWIFAVFFTFFGIACLATRPDAQIFGIVCLVVSAFDWYKIIKDKVR